MKTSIAMATYNGGKYLQEQLNSFVSQALLPDELVVCDDASSDDTVQILTSFALVAPFTVRVFENGKNLGHVKNFEKAISLCCGDIVFLSDQDDVWFETKIKDVSSAFSKNASALVVTNNQLIADKDLKSSGHTKLGNIRRLGHSDTALRTGCCTAFRKEFLQYILPFPENGSEHDTWINRLADLMGRRIILEQPLQLFRRHGNNTSDWIASSVEGVTRFEALKAYGLKDARLGWEKNLIETRSFRSRLETVSSVLDEKGIASIGRLQQQEKALELRIAAAKVGRIRRGKRILQMLLSGQYRHFNGWKSALKDAIRP